MFKTTDLCDAHEVDVLPLAWRHFGKRPVFYGQVTTLKVYQDNAQVRTILAEPGTMDGAPRVLVVDGAGSLATALLGDQLAALGAQNGWGGVILAGAVRDAADLINIDLGIVALGTVPRKSSKNGNGVRDQAITLAGVAIPPKSWIYCDLDGVLVSTKRLPLAPAPI